MKKTKIVVALGGNAIQNKGEKGTFEEQYRNVEKTMGAVVELMRNPSFEIVITHGNGPQVGNIMLQQQAARQILPEMPMHMCGAMSQGQIGYLIQQSLYHLMRKKRIQKHITTIVTQTVVDEKSDAFKKPSKPVGPYYSKKEADDIGQRTGYVFREDAGRGYRRVVPSPLPKELIEIDSIRALVDRGDTVIASGGGGIPVVRKGRALVGVDAVIDKDRAAALMADELMADLLIILTAVEKVCLNYGKPDEQKLATMTTREASEYLKQGHFAPGSMGPKIEAAIAFVRGDKRRKCIITHAHTMQQALDGRNGTVITN